MATISLRKVKLVAARSLCLSCRMLHTRDVNRSNTRGTAPGRLQGALVRTPPPLRLFGQGLARSASSTLGQAV